MGKIVIKRNGQPHLDLVSRGKRTINSASQNKVILSDDSVTIRVQSNSVLDIKINDTFEVYGDVYRINQMPSVTKHNETSYEYDIVGQGLMFDLLRCKFFNADGSGFKTTRDFPLIGTIEVFLLALKANMQRLSVDWEIGNFTNGETKTITFSDDTCLSALQKICQEFNTEFWVKAEVGKFKIHTGNFGSTLPQTLQYGKGKGLYNLSRKNVNENGIINKLYVDGGTQNIPADYRQFSDRLKFSDDGYIEDTALIAEHGLKEGSIVFDDIYPHRTGVISAVNGVFKFSDASMDFDLNEKEADGITTKYLIAGTTAKIHFNTGNLAGYQFEVKSYNHTTKEFEIIQFDNQNGQKFPDADSAAFQFAVGDEYVLLDIVMPQSYVDNAETELLTKGNEQFALLKQAKVSYDLNVAEDFLKTLATPLQIGDMVQVVDSALGIDKTLRVNQITRNFIQNGTPNDYDYKIVIADSYEVAFASKLVLDIQKVKNVINVNKIDQLRLSRLGLQVTEELKNNIFDTDGYFDTDNIKPESIETGMLSVGSRSQAISTNLIFRTNVGGNANSVNGDTFKVYSQTLNKEWNLPAFAQVIPDNNLRYVYAKVSKTNTTGAINITTAKIPYDSDPNDYYILLGMLSSVIEGARVFVPTYGLTTITGGLIRTGIISDEGGTFQINLNTGVITADQITFKAPDNSYKDLTDTIGDIDDNLVNLNAVRDYVNNVLPGELETIQNQIDGSITNWFYGYEPTLLNAPANTWTTTELKNIHLGDVFYDTVTGYAYRFKVVNNVYSWERITDSDVTKALADAANAQDTADAKRRVFVAQPVPPYDIGDLWVQGTSGEIIRCATMRLSGNFVAGDWVKASKYTDDTRAVQAENNAKSYTDGQISSVNNEISQLETAVGTLQTDVANLPIGSLSETALFGIKQQKNGIQAEYNDVYNRYVVIRDDAFLTDKTALNTAYGSLGTSGTGYARAYELLLEAFDTAFSDSAITQPEKDNLEAKFTAYKSHLSTLSNALQTSLKTIEQNKIDNIQIGGRNLVLNSNGLISPISTHSASVSESSEIPPQFTSGKSTKFSPTQDVHYLRIHTIKEVGTYTFSAWIKRTNGDDYPLQISANDVGYKNFSITNAEWRFITHTVKITNVTSIYNFFDLRTQTKWVEFLLYNVKIEKGNKATDWTPAPEDINLAISNAQTSANTANSLLADIANDNLLTPSEKQNTKKEWDIIVGEKTIIEGQATAVGVSHASYTGAYNALNTYLSDLLTSLTTNSAINGNTFRTNFKTYYDAKIALLKAVTDKLKADTTAVSNRLSAEEQKVIAVEDKTDFLTTDINGNVMATGTLLVGQNSTTNAGITGTGDVNNGIFLWGGETYLNRANANVWMKRNGHFRFKTATGLEMDSQTGLITVRHTNGQIGIKLGLDGGNPLMQFFKSDGTKVYELGANGIYYVGEIAESFTLWRFAFLNRNDSTSDLTIFHNDLRGFMWQKSSNPDQFELRGNKDAYLYDAGRNASSASNEQYEGYKNSSVNMYHTNNVADGWYAVEQLGWMGTDGIDESKKEVYMMRIINGKETAQSGVTYVETDGYYFNQF